jgi:uncharacterized protein with PIN domain
MFYVKEPLKMVEITVEINDENVFCRCPVCGREILVIWKEVLGDGKGDLFGTAVLCEECAREWMELHGKKSEA